MPTVDFQAIHKIHILRQFQTVEYTGPGYKYACQQLFGKYMKVDWKLTTSCTGEGVIHTEGFYPVDGGGGGEGASTTKNSNCSATTIEKALLECLNQL